MVVLPACLPVIVTVVPLTDAVAMVLDADDTLNVPWAPLTVNVPVLGYVIEPLVALRLIGFVAFLVYNVYVALDAL